MDSVHCSLLQTDPSHILSPFPVVQGDLMRSSGEAIRWEGGILIGLRVSQSDIPPPWASEVKETPFLLLNELVGNSHCWFLCGASCYI